MCLWAYIKFSGISVHCSTNSDALGKQTLYQYMIIIFIKDFFQLVHSLLWQKQNHKGQHKSLRLHH